MTRGGSVCLGVGVGWRAFRVNWRSGRDSKYARRAGAQWVECGHVWVVVLRAEPPALVVIGVS